MFMHIPNDDAWYYGPTAIAIGHILSWVKNVTREVLCITMIKITRTLCEITESIR